MVIESHFVFFLIHPIGRPQAKPDADVVKVQEKDWDYQIITYLLKVDQTSRDPASWDLELSCRSPH